MAIHKAPAMQVLFITESERLEILKAIEFRFESQIPRNPETTDANQRLKESFIYLETAGSVVFA